MPARAPGHRKPVAGIQVRHQSRCPATAGNTCGCTPVYQAQVWSARDRKPIRKTFRTLAAAREWRQDSQVALRRGTMRAPTPTTVTEAARQWMAAAQAGVIRTRSGETYKPSALRTYQHALDSKLLPRLGYARLSTVTRNDIQDLIDHLTAQGLSPSTVHNAVLPLRAIYRRAVLRCEVAVNPTHNLQLPTVRTTRDRVARPEEARDLIHALPSADRALWATALYSGLRRGELLALRWEDVDLDGNLIHVARGWDRKAGPIEPKSRSGKRTVPIPQLLRSQLLGHRLQQGRGGLGLVFGRTPVKPFDPPTVVERAKRHWRAKGLHPIGLHECRHTYAAYAIAAGINTKALSTYMGHASITITLDRYGHLLPGNETEAASLLNRYLEPGRG